VDCVNHGNGLETVKNLKNEKVLKLTIFGELGSKSNSRRMVSFGGRPRLIKSDKALKYEESSTQQIINQLRAHRAFTDYVRLSVDVYYSSKRPDLDVALLQDILQTKVDRKTGIKLYEGAYENDRQVVEIHARKFWEKENPRCEITVEEIGAL